MVASERAWDSARKMKNFRPQGAVAVDSDVWNAIDTTRRKKSKKLSPTEPVNSQASFTLEALHDQAEASVFSSLPAEEISISTVPDRMQALPTGEIPLSLPVWIQPEVQPVVPARSSRLQNVPSASMDLYVLPLPSHASQQRDFIQCFQGWDRLEVAKQVIKHNQESNSRGSIDRKENQRRQRRLGIIKNGPEGSYIEEVTSEHEVAELSRQLAEGIVRDSPEKIEDVRDQIIYLREADRDNNGTIPGASPLRFEAKGKIKVNGGTHTLFHLVPGRTQNGLPTPRHPTTRSNRLTFVMIKSGGEEMVAIERYDSHSHFNKRRSTKTL